MSIWCSIWNVLRIFTIIFINVEFFRPNKNASNLYCKQSLFVIKNVSHFMKGIFLRWPRLISPYAPSSNSKLFIFLPYKLCNIMPSTDCSKRWHRATFLAGSLTQSVSKEYVSVSIQPKVSAHFTPRLHYPFYKKLTSNINAPPRLHVNSVNVVVYILF